MFTNNLEGFNMYKLIHKLTNIKPLSATLLDNIYTNLQITIDNCTPGILISDISDHFLVFGAFDDMSFSPTPRDFKTICFTEKNIMKFTNIFLKQETGNFTIMLKVHLQYFMISS